MWRLCLKQGEEQAESLWTIGLAMFRSSWHSEIKFRCDRLCSSSYPVWLNEYQFISGSNAINSLHALNLLPLCRRFEIKIDYNILIERISNAWECMRKVYATVRISDCLSLTHQYTSTHNIRIISVYVFSFYLNLKKKNVHVKCYSFILLMRGQFKRYKLFYRKRNWGRKNIFCKTNQRKK